MYDLNTLRRATPAAGGAAQIGSPVNIVVASGYKLVPTVVGSHQSDADKAIWAAGLSLGSTTYKHDDSTYSGTVLSQNPAGGSMVPTGTSVNLTISLGPSNPPPSCFIACP